MVCRLAQLYRVPGLCFVSRICNPDDCICRFSALFCGKQCAKHGWFSKLTSACECSQLYSCVKSRRDFTSAVLQSSLLFLLLFSHRIYRTRMQAATAARHVLLRAVCHHNLSHCHSDFDVCSGASRQP